LVMNSYIMRELIAGEPEEEDSFETDNIKNFELLKELLEKVGVNFKIDSHETEIGKEIVRTDTLYISLDSDKYHRIVSRAAGRHGTRIDTNNIEQKDPDGFYDMPTYNDAMAYIESVGGMDAAAKMWGISKRTLYRKLKDAKETGWFK